MQLGLSLEPPRPSVDTHFFPRETARNALLISANPEEFQVGAVPISERDTRMAQYPAVCDHSELTSRSTTPKCESLGGLDLDHG